MIKPRTPAPALDLPLVAGGRWRLADRHPEAFSLVLFYRGLRCPVCRGRTSNNWMASSMSSPTQA